MLDKFNLDAKVLKILYESLENLCTSYGLHGHVEAACRDLEMPMDTRAMQITPPNPYQ
ncbi:hypothetical protein LINGRAHAP2_LOCUS30160 [Linum grandiflorum]